MTDRNNPTSFRSHWQFVFGAVPPLGWALRSAFPAHWVRFHSLSGGQRFPLNDNDKKTIRHRANALAGACFGGGGKIWVAAGFWENDPHADSQLKIFSTLRMVHQYDWVDPTEPPEHQTAMAVMAAELSWHDGVLDLLFDAIAQDKTRAVLFDATNPIALAPYDGGFDVVGFGKGLIPHLNVEFAEWASKRQDRL